MRNYIVILTFSVFIGACKNGKQPQQVGSMIPTLPVMQIPNKDIEGTSTYPVSLEGIVNAEVRAKIQGYITEVLADEGAYVQKGQQLFKLETQSLTEDAQAANANVDAAQVGVDQLRPLVEQNIISKIQLQTAEAKLAQAKATYKSVIANVDYANISSPVSGYVGRINYRQGSLVNPGNPLPITTVSNTNEVYGYFAMNEADYIDFLQKSRGRTLTEKMKNFPQVQLKMSNGEIYSHVGKIQTVTAQVDPLTGTVNFRAAFPNPEHLLANGSSGTIVIPKAYKNVIVIPAEATFEMQGKVYVYQYMPDSTVKQVIIDLTDKIGPVYVVKSGIDAGSKIVVQGAEKLRNGDKVSPTVKTFDALVENLKPVFK